MWEDYVRKVEPYVPGEQPKVSNLIKLNTNENPYPPAPGVFEVLKHADATELKKYPDPTCSVLVDALADFYHVDREKIFVGVGSDDVLSMAFLTFYNSDVPILFPNITYSFYDVWANLYRIPYKQIPLMEDFSVRKEDYYQANGGVILANPNAPTGANLPFKDVEDILEHNRDVVVIVDEAYADFGGESVLPLIDKYDNLLVVQTFSKSRALAGLRIGYAFGCKKLIKYMLDVKFSFNSYTMNRPALEMGAASLRDRAYFEEKVAAVIKTREWTKGELKRLGFSFADSKTNFIFARHESVPRDYIFTRLREENILVRAFKGDIVKDYLRISIGTDEEMRVVIETLEKILKEK